MPPPQILTEKRRAPLETCVTCDDALKSQSFALILSLAIAIAQKQKSLQDYNIESPYPATCTLPATLSCFMLWLRAWQARGDVRLSAANQPFMSAIICRLPTFETRLPCLARVKEGSEYSAKPYINGIPHLGVRILIPPRAEESRFSAKALHIYPNSVEVPRLGVRTPGRKKKPNLQAIQILRHSDSCFAPERVWSLAFTMMKPQPHGQLLRCNTFHPCVRRAFVRSDVSRNCFERLSNIFTCRPVSK